MLPPIHVLVVEDHEDLREVLCESLDSRGFATTGAANGTDAIRACEGTAFDCVLLDLDLPDMEGAEVARTLRTHGYAGTLIAMSGYTDARHRQSAIESGCDLFALKPVLPPDLMRMLETVRPRR